MRTEQGAWRLHAGCAYERGEQLFVSYGERDNLRWLLHYGFALADNPEQRVAFDVIDLVRVALAVVSMAIPVLIPLVSGCWQRLLTYMGGHGSPGQVAPCTMHHATPRTTPPGRRAGGCVAARLRARGGEAAREAARAGASLLTPY